MIKFSGDGELKEAKSYIRDDILHIFVTGKYISKYLYA